MGLVWSVPVPSKEMTGREQGGGGIISRWGCPKPFWEEGSYGMLSPSPEFPTPFAAL